MGEALRTRLIITTVAEPLLVNAAAATYDMDLVRKEMLPELRGFVEQAQAERHCRRRRPSC